MPLAVIKTIYMADTIIERDTSVRDTGDSSAGWAVAIIVLLAVIVFGAVYFYRHGAAAPANSGSTNINVTLPSGGSGSTGGTSGGTTQ